MTEPAPTEQPRELGVAIDTCPICGSPVKQVELPDGGITGEPCQKCYPGETPVVGEIEYASERPLPREQGTTVVVTDTPKEN